MIAGSSIQALFRQHRRFLFLLVLLFLLFSLGIAYGGRKVYTSEQERLQAMAEFSLGTAQAVVSSVVGDLAEEVRFVLDSPLLLKHLEPGGDFARVDRELRALLTAFQSSHRHFRAAILLDAAGGECFSAGAGFVKAGLERTQIEYLLANAHEPETLYLLPMERVEAEQAWKIGTPLFDAAGRRKGFFILVLDSARFLDLLPATVFVSTAAPVPELRQDNDCLVASRMSDTEVVYYGRLTAFPGQELHAAAVQDAGPLKQAMLRLTGLLLFLFSIFAVLLLFLFFNRISRFRELVNAQKIMVFSLANLAEWRDPETGDHLERTRNYGVLLAGHLRATPKYRKVITARFLEDLRDAAPLHDIGKVGVPDAILLKEGPLNAEEFEVIKRHVRIGSDVLQRVLNQFRNSEPFLVMSRNIAFYHHEKFDGSGYPQGLRGEDIPLEARIYALCDAYDAIRSRRPYKDEIPHEEAVRRIQAGRGSHFDPDVVDAFLDCEQEFMEIHETYSLFSQAFCTVFSEECARTLTVRWGPEMAVGIQAIDRQHQELIARINRLFQAILEGRGKEEAAVALDFLGGYVVRHFATEEKLMLETCYPEYAAHKKEHEDFLRDFQVLARELAAGGISSQMVVRINRQVVHWLVNHIMEVDRKLVILKDLNP